MSEEAGSSSGGRKYECPVCYEFMLPPIYQCRNGHLMCNKCMPQLKNCAICRDKLPRRMIRNLEVEEIVAAEKYPCMNTSRGCKEILNYKDMEEHTKQCVFMAVNFCRYLGFRGCNDLPKADELFIHLMTVHNLSGEFISPRDVVEIQQLGAEPSEIEEGKVEWRPIYIVVGDMTYFVRTKLMAGTISWNVSALGDVEKVKDLRASIVFSTDDLKAAVLTWKGPMTDIKTGFNDKNVFSIPSQRLVGLTNWTLKVRIVPDEPVGQQPTKTTTPLISRPYEINRPSASGAQGGSYTSSIACKACDIPIDGARFKCTECPNYYLCKSCCTEKNVHGEHIFLMAASGNPSLTNRLDQAARNLQGSTSNPMRQLLQFGMSRNLLEHVEGDDSDEDNDENMWSSLSEESEGGSGMGDVDEDDADNY